MNDRYRKSRELWERAVKTIPLASQTFSKSHLVFPSAASPLFLERGDGSHVWDVDGNEYVDFVNGLLPVVLGYNDPDVNRAVADQLTRGVSFSLPTPLEVELAELLVELIPCAEQVRFGKNGTDATSAAIRIARAHTGRDRVATCGYHGWQDWYIGATARHKGVPQAVRDLTRVFPYNDLDALARLLAEHPGQYAAVIMEPMNADEPRAGFLEGVRALAHEHGALFILDEIITGFRYHLGGAQSLFGVEPDLATFGKSMGNGFPISAVVGKARYMREMEEIFFSGTFGGEAVSLAAAIATIGKMRREPVLETLHERGARVIEHVGRALDAHGLSDCIRMKGRPSWSLMQFSDRPGASLWEIKSLYLQEMLAQGILTAGSHNMCYAHTDADLDRLFTAQERAFGSVARALAAGDIRDRLAGPAIQPIFRVR